MRWRSRSIRIAINDDAAAFVRDAAKNRGVDNQESSAKRWRRTNTFLEFELRTAKSSFSADETLKSSSCDPFF
jgi:hypothetical protein